MDFNLFSQRVKWSSDGLLQQLLGMRAAQTATTIALLPRALRTGWRTIDGAAVATASPWTLHCNADVNCHEVENCDRFLDRDNGNEISCITDHEDFQPVCLHRAVLRTVLIARLDVRGSCSEATFT